MFEVGDLVDASVECSYPGIPSIIIVIYRGTVTKLLSENKASVHFKIPHLPSQRSVCDRCGAYGLLSKNGATGEIVCMRSGCGHSHGFEEWDSTFPLDKLVNITAKEREEKKTKFNARLAAVLREGVKENFLTASEMDKILTVAHCLPS